MKDSKINIFVSYSHNNSSWVDKEDSFNLIPFLQDSLDYLGVNIWYDHDLKTLPGIEYERKINDEIDKADIIILLLSRDFINSKFIMNKELPRIRKKINQNNFEFIPILVEPWTVPENHPAFWLKQKQIIPGSPTPLLNFTDSRINFLKARNIILESLERTIYRIKSKRNVSINDKEEKKSYNEETSGQSKFETESKRTNKSTIHEIENDKSFFYKLLKSLISNQNNSSNVQVNSCIFLDYEGESLTMEDVVNYSEKIKNFKPIVRIKFKKEVNRLKYTPKDVARTILFFDDSDENIRKSNIDTIIKSPEEMDIVLMKMSYPIAKGNLFSSLSEYYKISLTLVTSLDEIRKEAVMISKGVSWEQTALDLIFELTYNKNIRGLLNCSYLIITIGFEGALYLMINNREIVKAQLIFDNSVIEGEWNKKNRYPDDLGDKLDFFISGLLYEHATTEYINFVSAVSTGIYSSREIQRALYSNKTEQQTSIIDSVKKGVINPIENYALAFVPIPSNNLDIKPKSSFRNLKWTIQSGDYFAANKPTPSFDLGLRIAIFGEAELLNTPVLRIGHFISYDRFEIESVRFVDNLMVNYFSQQNVSPLSLSVFGLPGTEKTFVIKQIAKSKNQSLLSFNLSRFSDANLLKDAFYKIKEKTQDNACPIIIWEEFDTNNYYWLKHFLYTMQTGMFMDGFDEQVIGKCVFVFSSGFTPSFETFGMTKTVLNGSISSEHDDNTNINGKANNQTNSFNDNKEQEFLSLISGSLNVKGINKTKTFNKEKGQWFNDNDILFPIRRALLLRTVYGISRKGILNGDFGLINALLRIDYYKNDTLSFKGLAKIIKQKGNREIKREHLPNYRELERFMNYNRFISLIDEVDELKFMAYQATKEVHNFWLERGNKEGWKLEMHIPFDYLPSHFKNDNLFAVYRIPKVLARIDCKIVSERDAKFYSPFNLDSFLLQNKDVLEKLAKIEHDEWMKHKFDEGWRFSEKRNDHKKQHNCLVDYQSLPFREKDKDKDAVRHYQTILKKAGFVIVKE